MATTPRTRRRVPGAGREGLVVAVEASCWDVVRCDVLDWDVVVRRDVVVRWDVVVCWDVVCWV
jgi:hypothetical protein